MNQVNKDKERKSGYIAKVNIGVINVYAIQTCLKENHKTKHCKVPEKPCMHCRENRKHHRSLCPKKFRMKSTVEEQEKKYQPASGTETGMIAIGEKVVMQTALVSVGCNDKFYRTRALLDTGSTRTHVTEELTKMLKAKPVEQKTFSVYSFGNTKAKQKTPPVVDLVIKIKTGKQL